MPFAVTQEDFLVIICLRFIICDCFCFNIFSVLGDSDCIIGVSRDSMVRSNMIFPPSFMSRVAGFLAVVTSSVITNCFLCIVVLLIREAAK